MKPSLAAQVRSYMEHMGEGFTPAKLAAEVAKFQRDLPENRRCKRQNIEQLLQQDFKTVLYLPALAAAMGTTVEALDFGTFQPGEMSALMGPAGPYSRSRTPTPIDLDDNPEYPAVRRVRIKLSAGATGFGVDYDAEEGPPIVFRRDWYERNGYRPERLLAVQVGNGSMEPGLYDGDTVIINTEATEPVDGAVFAVNYEGELVIKRLVRDAGQWWLSSDNPDQRRYPRKVCDEHCLLLGRIVHKQSERI